jgi:predicted dehydrogenase
MAEPFKLAIIGLDTSHAVEFPKLMQDPTIPEERKIPQLKVTKALRFPSAFQPEAGQDARQQYLESIGITVTRDFDEAVSDCDGILIEINDPSLHLEYFEKCAKLGKSIFLDKPFADNWANTMKIMEIAKENNVRFFTSSALRFDYDITNAKKDWGKLACATIFGPVGTAPSGSSIIWYGCHTVEMLQTVMGRGAVAVDCKTLKDGYIFTVSYPDGRHGVIDMSKKAFRYGIAARDIENNTLQFVQASCQIPFYCMLLKEAVKFFNGEEVLPLEDSLEVMSILDACDRAAKSGKTEIVYSC